MAEVVIVGAGPVGLAASLFLAGYGVRSTLIDESDGRPCVGSRSICIARWTLEAFERIGCGRDMVDEGVSWELGRTYFRDRELFQTRFPQTGEESFPPFVNLGQQRVEELLLERVSLAPEIDTCWNHTVERVTQDGGGVEALARLKDGRSTTIRGDYVLACDGSRSAVRENLGVGFPGESHRDRFLILDLRCDPGFAKERRFFFDHPRNPGRQVLIHPQPDQTWRIDWQVPEDFDIDNERRSGRLDRRIRDLIGETTAYEVVWESVYLFEQRVAEMFRDRRAFLVGDAAHAFSPFGARGMNSGVQDAENLAWKLCLVLRGSAPDRLLDSYDVERRAAARHNLAVTAATMRFLAPPSPWHRALRNSILRASTRARSLRRFVNSGRLSEPYDYRDSPIVGDGGGGIAPDAPCEHLGYPNRGGRFRDVLGRGFIALRFGPAPAQHRRAPMRGKLPNTQVSVLEIEVSEGGPADDATRASLVDSRGRLAAALGARPDDLVLVRPDGHIASRRRDVDRVKLPSAVASAMAKPTDQEEVYA